LTRQLLAFSRKQIMQPQVLNPNTLIEDLSKMLTRVIRENIEFEFRPGQDVARVKVDPGQLEQVVMNLVVNAKDAMPTGGRVVIETANVFVGEDFARQHAPMQAGEYVMLSVSDTGSGMDSGVMAHIFEPFFTTKQPGIGTGLGLSIVYGIVKQSGGYIWVDSEPNQGTTFRVYLPPTTEAETASVPAVAPSTLHGTETILIVEDEPSLRAMTRTVLRDAGYKVFEAANGTEALSFLRNTSQPVHLLITDIVMPGGINGLELGKAAAEIHPHLRCLYMTGFAGEMYRFGLNLDPVVAVITKPFGTDLLFRRVREVLEGSPTPKAAITH
jgi:CheY-like chemotaxis protein